MPGCMRSAACCALDVGWAGDAAGTCAAADAGAEQQQLLVLSAIPGWQLIIPLCSAAQGQQPGCCEHGGPINCVSARSCSAAVLCLVGAALNSAAAAMQEAGALL